MNKVIVSIAVVLIVAPMTGAGVWDWVFGTYFGWNTPGSQVLGFVGSMGQVAANAGPGTTSNVNTGSFGRMQSGPAGVQSQQVYGVQTTNIAGAPGSLGMTSQSLEVRTLQVQWR